MLVAETVFICWNFSPFAKRNSFKKASHPGVDPTKKFFLCFFFFGIKLGHFAINNFFSVCNKNASLQQKTEKFFVSEEKKLGRIDSWAREKAKCVSW